MTGKVKYKQHHMGHPSKDARDLFNFLERTKKGGVVSGNKVVRYLADKKFDVSHDITYRKPYVLKSYAVYNERGTHLGNISLTKRRVVTGWMIN